MSKLKLTPWFGGEVRPARVGVYEKKGFTFPYYFWSGKYWTSQFGETPEQCGALKNAPKSLFQNASWRGLAVKP